MRLFCFLLERMLEQDVYGSSKRVFIYYPKPKY